MNIDEITALLRPYRTEADRGPEDVIRRIVTRLQQLDAVEDAVSRVKIPFDMYMDTGPSDAERERDEAWAKLAAVEAEARGAAGWVGAAGGLARRVLAAIDAPAPSEPPAPPDAELPEGWRWDPAWLPARAVMTENASVHSVSIDGEGDVEIDRWAPVPVVLAVLRRAGALPEPAPPAEVVAFLTGAAESACARPSAAGYRCRYSGARASDWCLPCCAGALLAKYDSPAQTEKPEPALPAEVVQHARALIERCEAPDQCLVCDELLDKPENDNGDGELLGHTLHCPVPHLAEALDRYASPAPAGGEEG